MTRIDAAFLPLANSIELDGETMSKVAERSHVIGRRALEFSGPTITLAVFLWQSGHTTIEMYQHDAYVYGCSGDSASEAVERLEGYVDARAAARKAVAS